MKRITFLLLAVASLAGVVAFTAFASRRAHQEGTPIFVTKIPPGYRDWRLVSVAHEEGKLNDIRGILGNDVAIKAYREGKLPFPEGTIIGRIAWRHVPSEENNKAFGRAQSFVAGDAPPWYLQFMVKNSKKYAATGGWGYAQIRQGRQTWPGVRHENLLSLPPGYQTSRLCLHSVLTLIWRAQGNWRNGRHATQI